MSRLIVKNLPAYLSDGRLREHFSQKGLVTDVKLMTRPDGTSRRFGFVGYRSEQEAQEAREYFHRTFIDTSRIQVDVAKKIGDDSLPQRRVAKGPQEDASDVAETSAAGAAKAGAKAAVQQAKPSRKDKAAAAKGVSFEEFMAVMAPNRKRKTESEGQGDAVEEAMGVEANQSPAKKKTKKDKGAADPSAPVTNTAEADEPGREATPDEALNDEGMTDLDYMHQRMKRNVAAPQKPDKAFEQSDSEDDDESDASSGEEGEDPAESERKRQRLEEERAALEERAQKDQENVDTLMSTGRLFVRNLPFAATEEELNNHFAAYGSVKQAHIPLDKTTKASKGMAFVAFEEPAHALAAFRAADGSTFQGRLLHLLPAVDLRPKPEKAATLKQSRQEERKANADRDFNWSSLYMSADAVASSVADRLGVSKSDIVNPSNDSGGDSAAVRLALAETKVIQETKEFLEKEGVNVAAFEGGPGKGGRSDTTILVKNIPYGTAPETIREMFERHGEVDRVLIPPTGTLALVEMVVPGEARVAYKALAYKRIGNSILYLEKAPAGVIASKRNEGDAQSAPSSVPVPPPSKQRAMESALGSGAGSEAEAEPGATLFVKNLSFATTDATLATLFSTLADFAFARVQTRPDGRDPTKRLSMGYGFVGYRSAAAAQTAVNALNGKDLDGHALALSFARRGQDADDSAVKGGSSTSKLSSTKLVVKNLPFEATKKEVRALFSAHGTLKSVRVPRKSASVAGAAGGGARGFAFVEFTSKREAQNAFEALRHAHLLGRHLVLQWDREDAGGVEGIRAKVKESFDVAQSHAANGSRSRKAKLNLGEEDIAEAVRKEREKRDDVDE